MTTPDTPVLGGGDKSSVAESELAVHAASPEVGAGLDVPRDREIWISTEEDGIQQVRFCSDTKLYTGEEVWRRTDGESGSWSLADITGWMARDPEFGR